MIVVTGGNGKLGQAVIQNLLAFMTPDRIVACVRDMTKSSVFTGLGVEVRHGDFTAPHTLKDAFKGAEQVFITSVDQFGEEARRMHRTAIKSAVETGAKRVLYTSHMGARPSSAFADHCDAEAALADSGNAFTALRHGFYTASAFHLIGNGLETGEIRVPEDGPISWTARADLALADAAILAHAGKFDGVTPALTALEAFTMADLAAIASELTGKTIKRTVVPDDQWLKEQTDKGVPAHMANALLGMYQSARRGEMSETNSTLADLIGKRPQTMRDALANAMEGYARTL